MKIEYGNVPKNIVKNIWEKSFNDDENTINFYFDYIYDENNFLNLKNDNKILSSLHENKYTLNFNKNSFKTNYIVGVTTDITERYNGYMSKILNYSLQNSFKKNTPMVFLSAINSSIYRKFGFEYFSSIETYKIPMTSISELTENRNLAFKEINRKNIDIFLDELIFIYNENMKNIFISLKRDNFYFKKLLMECFNDKMNIVATYENGKMNGYIIYGINSEVIEVREIFALNLRAKISLIKLLSAYKDYCTKIIINSPQYSNIDLLFKNQVKIKKSISHFMMARITNVAKIFKMLDIEENIKIFVLDEIIPENNGIFDLSKKNILKEASNSYDIKININDLTPVILGYLSIDELKSIRNIDTNEETFKKLRKIFNKKINYLYEFI